MERERERERERDGLIETRIEENEMLYTERFHLTAKITAEDLKLISYWYKCEITGDRDERPDIYMIVQPTGCAT